MDTNTLSNINRFDISLDIIQKEFIYIREELHLTESKQIAALSGIDTDFYNKSYIGTDVVEDSLIQKEFKKIREELSIDIFAA